MVDSAGTGSGSAADRLQAETQGPRHLGALGTIHDAASVCRKLFEEYLSDSRAYHQRVSVCQRQFLVWTKFSGVFAHVSVRLDTRLQGTPEMTELFFDMLEVLQTNLELGIKSHCTGDWTGDHTQDDDVMYGIEGAVDRLTRLSLIVQTPRRPDAIERVLRWSQNRGPDGFDESILSLIQRMFQTPNFLMPESLQIQLASTITFRRNRLKYHASHENDNIPSSKHQDDILMENPERDTSPVSAPLQNLGAYPESYPAQQAAQQHEDTTQSQHTLSQYPKAPTIPEGGRQATCSLCFKTVSRTDLETDQKWRAHVNQDLRPYICISEQCGIIAPAFPTYLEWRDHMVNHHGNHWAQRVHRPHHWVCPLSHEASCHFNTEIDGQSEQGLLAHMQMQHSNDDSELEIVSLASFCKVLQPLKANVCPLCGAEVSMDETSSATASVDLIEATSKHIADHLEAIAVWSLYETGQNPADLSVNERRFSTEIDQTTLANTSRSRTSSMVATRHTGSVRFQGLPTSVQRNIDNTASNPESPGLMSESSSSQGAHDMEVLPPTVQTNHRVSDFSREANFLEDYLEDYLEGQIAEAYVVSVFPEGPRQEFIPNDKLEELVTQRSVTKTLLAAGGDGSVNDQMYACIEYVLTSAKRLFVISLICGLSGKRLRMAMESFHSHSLSDEDLPLTSLEGVDHHAAFKNRAWSKLTKRLFVENQWKVLAPVFPKRFARLYLEPEQILPFTDVASERRRGTFGDVYQVTILASHQEDPSRKADGSLASVAIKELRSSGNADSTLDAEWQAEANALEDINKLVHAHIVPVKAIITRGTRTYFMFEWADGGNLRDLYERDIRSTLTSQDVNEVIMQLSGVVDAIYALHHYQDAVRALPDYQGADAAGSYRHGDLKPENILRVRDSTRMGVWKIGDMGLAKRHYSATRERTHATVTIAATPSYEPPEVYTMPRAARSRLYDIWSMGCITLELIIWLLYGPTEVVKFNRRLGGPVGDPGPYWVCDEEKDTATLHPVVLKYIDHIKRDPECRWPMETALGDLLRIVETELLVVALPPRRALRSSTWMARASDAPEFISSDVSAGRRDVPEIIISDVSADRRDVPEIIISDVSAGRREARQIRSTAAKLKASLAEIRHRGNERGLRYMFSGRDRKGVPGPSFDDRYSDIVESSDQQASSLRAAAAPTLSKKVTDRTLPSTTVSSVQLKTSDHSKAANKASDQAAWFYQPVVCYTA